MQNFLADTDLFPPGQPGFRGTGRLGLEGLLSADSLDIFASALSATIGIISVIGGIWFTYSLIIAAITIITAGEDKAKMASARAKITSSLVGLVMLIAGVFLVDLIGSLLGINILNIRGAIINIRI